MWNFWKLLFTSVADKHAPLRTKRVSNKSPPWITPELKSSIINRNYLKRLCTRVTLVIEVHTKPPEITLTIKYDRQKQILS